MNILPVQPKLACCNFIEDPDRLREFAIEYGFSGVEWDFDRDPDNMPRSFSAQAEFARTIRSLSPLEVRFHCGCSDTDLGDSDEAAANRAMDVLKAACRLVSKAAGRYMTVHVGLGRDSTMNLSWNRTLVELGDLTRYANNLGINLCLENWTQGWTSRPELFEKLIRKTGIWATLDIGHAQVSPQVTGSLYSVEDFVAPHPERFRGAHIYHEEIDGLHRPPYVVADLSDRLRLLRRLPLCDWWVLELREEGPLLQTLEVVREFLQMETSTEVV
jgi:sugar phosphate isomerase/epimerase